MFHSKKVRLLTGYFALWLLGTTILNAFPASVQAGFAASTPTTTSPAGLSGRAGDIVGISREGAEAVSLTSSQIGLKTKSLTRLARPRQILPVRSRSGAITTPEATGQTVPAPGSVNPLDFSSFPSLDYSFPGNTASQDDIDNLPFQPLVPDTMGAAGPSQFVMAINGMLRVFTKDTGVPEHPFGATDPDLDTFFSSVMTPVAETDNEINYTTFPRVRYDRFSSRWFILVNDVPGGLATHPNRILLAVSSGPVITAGTVWKFFYFQLNGFFASYPDSYADNPTLGIDTNALYIGANLYNTGGNQALSNTAAFVVRKSSILGSGPIVVTGFTLLETAGGPFTPVGVDNLDGSVSDGYFIGVNSTSTTKLQLRRVTNPGGTPILSGNIPVTVDPMSQPLLVPHKGGGTDTKSKLDPVDNRLSNAVIHNGSLWTAQNIAVDHNGTNNSPLDRDGVRWYEIMLSPVPTKTQSGTVFDSSSSLKSYWVPSLTVSGQGHTVMGLNVAGANDFISAAFAGRTAGDSLSTMRPPVLYKTSTIGYAPENNTGDNLFGRRWGDYSFTSLDPEDNMTFWTIQEYAYNSDSTPNDQYMMDGYGIQIARINAPPPATIVSASPSLVVSGQNNIDITVTGNSVDHSAFYEPGPNFPKHLTALVAGGITLNSVTYLGPTSVRLNISATGVTPGHYDLSIINPDGQTTTANLLNVTCSQEILDNAGDGDTGSIRDAVNNIINSNGCNTISLKNVSQPITLTNTLEIPAGINIITAKPCSDGKVEIDGTGVTGDGLVLNGGTFFGIYVHGFIGRQIVVNGHTNSNNATGPTAMSCIKAGAS